MKDFRLHDGKHGAALSIRVTPKARRTEFSGIREDGTIRIRVSAPAVEGKANKELIKFLSKVLKVRKNQIEIIAGEKGLDKIVSIVGMSAEQAQERILANFKFK